MGSRSGSGGKVLVPHMSSLPVKNTFIQVDCEPPLIRRVNSEPALLREPDEKKRKLDEPPRQPAAAVEATPPIESGKKRKKDAEADEKNLRRSKSRELPPEVRLGKRERYIATIKDTEGYKNYKASKGRGDEKAGKAPGTPDASDMKMSKRGWDEACRKWRNALKEFGEIPYEPHDYGS